MSGSILVAVPTLRRPGRLAVLLPELERQAHPLGATVLVVDNDPDGSAAEIARRSGARYALEAQPGLAAVRNRALVEASSFDALVFIDDDEVPAPGWLETLVAAWRHTGAAAVSGRVITRFPPGFNDPWIVAGGFFTRVAYPDGSTQPAAATNNLLLDLRELRDRKLQFDPSFGLSGGEDIDLTSRLTQSGGLIVACPAALVWDEVDPARLTREWVLWRAYRVGVTTARVAIRVRPGLSTRLRMTAAGWSRIAAGLARWLVGAALRRQRSAARGARAAWRGAGLFAGAWGMRYEEYARRAGEARLTR